MRGRKPVPTALANLHGRPSKTLPPRAEPKPVGELSDAPEWLTEGQRASWDYALRCAPPGLLKRIDRGALAVWVVAEDLHRQAAIAQSQTGLLVKTSKTQAPMQSPYLPIINRQGVIMLKAASELGFTPVSRPRIFASGPAPGEGLHGDAIPTSGTLDSFLDTDPDWSPTLN